MQMDFKCISNCLWGLKQAKRIGEMSRFHCSDDLGIQLSLLAYQKSLAHQWDSNYCIQNEWHKVNAARPRKSNQEELIKKKVLLKSFFFFFWKQWFIWKNHPPPQLNYKRSFAGRPVWFDQRSDVYMLKWFIYALSPIMHFTKCIFLIHLL